MRVLLLVMIIITTCFLAYFATLKHELQKELDRTEYNLNLVTSKLEAVRGEKELLEAENSQLKGELDDLTAALRAKEVEIEEKEVEIEELRVQLQAEKKKTEMATKRIVREFESERELMQWLAQDKTDEMEWKEREFDCDDFALTLAKNALRDGYFISIQYDARGAGGEGHLLNSTIIQGKLYLIEPQEDWIIEIGPLD